MYVTYNFYTSGWYNYYHIDITNFWLAITVSITILIYHRSIFLIIAN